MFRSGERNSPRFFLNFIRNRANIKITDMKNTIVTVISILIVAIALLYWWKAQLSSVPVSSQSKVSTTTQTGTQPQEFAGNIATTSNGQMLYTSTKIGLTFAFPQSWHVGSNSLGYGSFQLFNYDETAVSPKDSFAADTKMNKIEAGIGSAASFVNTEFPEKKRTTARVQITGGQVSRQDIEFSSGAKIRIYFIPVPHETGKFLSFDIAGDPNNFQVLDELVQSLRWLRA